MAEDIKITLGVEADNLIAALKKAINQLEALTLGAKETENAIEGIDNAEIDLDTSKAKSELDTLGKKAGDVADNGINKAAFMGAAFGGAIEGLAGGALSAAMSGISALGGKIMDGALAADEFGDTMEVAFRQQGIADVEGEMEKVRASTLGLANDLGLPVERTRELATTVATMGGVSGKQAEELTKLSAGLEVFSGGAVKGEAVALAFSKGLADPEGAAAIERLAKKYPQLAETLRSNLDPAEKMKVANELLGESFKTVAEQQGDAGGQLNKLQNIATEAFEVIGSGVYDAIGPIMTQLVPVLSEGIPKAMNFLIDIFNQAKDIIVNAFAGAGGPAINFENIISGVANVLKTTVLTALENVMGLVRMLWNLAVYAFEEIKKALDPVIQRMGGLEGITNGVKDVFKFLWSILEPIGRFMIDVLVYGISLAVSWFTKLWDAGMAVYNFFVNLNSIGAGVGAMFNSLVGTLGQVWSAITSFRWDQIGNIMAQGFTNAKQAYDQAYNATKKQGENVRAEQKKNEQVIVDSNKVINKSNEEIKPPKIPKAPKGGAPKQEQQKKDEDTAFEALKKQYELEEKELENKFSAELTIAERAGEDTKALEMRQQAERSRLLNSFLNERFGKVKDANRILTDEELLTIIKPSTKDGETVQDVIGFYREEIQKNQKALTAEAKLKADIEVNTLKSVSKEWSDSVKVFEQTMQKIVPQALATTQEGLKQTVEQVKTFIGFLEIQSIEIQNLLMTATRAGQTDTAKSLEESLNKVKEYLGTLKSRIDEYEKKSTEDLKKAENEKNIFLFSALSAREAVKGAFDFKAYKKEKQEAEKLREEKKKALDQEETDLRASFAKREITFENYRAKTAAINKKRVEDDAAKEKTFLDRLKLSGDKVASDILGKQAKAFLKQAEGMKDAEKVMFESLGNLSKKFGELAATGKATLKDFAGASIDIAVEALMKMIPIWTAQLFATTVSQLGPTGLAVAAGLQTVLLGLVFAARSAAGFKEGVVELQGEGTETSDSIPAWLSKGESVITARATKQNKEELEWMNKTGRSIKELYQEQIARNTFIDENGSLLYNLAQKSQISEVYDKMNHTSIESVIQKIMNTEYNRSSQDGIIAEIQELRKETKNLGKQITRHTTVDVSGKLTTDGRKIAAMVESNKRTMSRRG